MRAVTGTGRSGPPAGPVPPAPRGPAGRPYRYEMVHAGRRRVYADDPVDLVAVLAPGYREMDAQARSVARRALAVRAQTTTQAVLNTAPVFTRCTRAQQLILSGPRHEPPVVPSWDCPVPLVLVATDYQPIGRCPRPQPVAGMLPNVLWIDPSGEVSLLGGLAELGVIGWHEWRGPTR